MAGVRINVAADIGAARAVLARAKELATHPLGLMQDAATLLENSTRERFRTSRGPGGIPWPPSGRQRFAGQPSKGGVGPNPGGRTLVDRGNLLASVTSIASQDRAEVGIIAKTPSAKFAYVHQFGATIRPKKGPFLVFTAPSGHKVFARSVTIPARPFIGVDEEDRRDLLEAWTARLEAEI